MFQLRRLRYFLSVSTIITAVSSLFYKEGGELALFPGTFVEVMLTGLILLIPTGDYYFVFPKGTNFVLTSVIYGIAAFGLSEMVRLSKIYK